MGLDGSGWKWMGVDGIEANGIRWDKIGWKEMGWSWRGVKRENR